MQGSSEASDGGSGCRVLLADDSPIVRRRLRSLLAQVAGIRVVGEAGTGAEALELVERLDPDVVVLDIRMPEGNGFEVLRKAEAPKARATFIALSNHADPTSRRGALESGADYFYDKTTEFTDMLSTLAEIAASGSGPCG